MEKIPLSSTTKGRHSELVAATAFLAAGWDVLEPIVPTTYDLAVTKPGSKEIVRIQIKMISRRERGGTEYYVLKGRRNTGNPYSLEETDVFAGIVDGKVYMTENRVQSEYWVKVDEVDQRWTRLETGL